VAESKTRHVDSDDEAAKQQSHGNKQFLPHHALTANSQYMLTSTFGWWWRLCTTNLRFDIVI